MFADEETCLDQRLRESPEIKGLVMMMLQMFRVNLGYGTMAPIFFALQS